MRAYLIHGCIALAMIYYGTDTFRRIQETADDYRVMKKIIQECHTDKWNQEALRPYGKVDALTERQTRWLVGE